MLTALRRVNRRSVVVAAYATRSLETETAQFTVGISNGFLSRDPPLATLPANFSGLESLLERMPVTTQSGEKGLLYYGKFGDAVLNDLPNYADQVAEVSDSRILAALFRDYTFAASAYLLEPCGMSYVLTIWVH